MKNPELNKTKALIREMLQSSKLSLTKAVQRMNELYPEEKTSVQNISNKLSRDTISFAEVSNLADACEYHVFIKGIKDDETQLMTKSTDRELITNDSFKTLASEGYTSIKSPNFIQVVIVGKNSVEAADYLRDNLNSNMTDADEIALFDFVNKRFNVIIKPITQTQTEVSNNDSD